MKKTLLILLCLVMSFGVATAAANFDGTKKYRFSCAQNLSGALALGKYHGSQAYLYYDISPETADDAWWYIKKEGNGYTIMNAVDQTYITYYPERIENVAKGLVLTEAPQGESSLWTFEEMNNFLVIKSVESPDQWWNLRQDGSYLMGTYGGSGSMNELFVIYDENGQEVGVDKPLSGLSSALDSVRLNNKQLVYDQTSKQYFFPLPQSMEAGENYTAKLTYKLKSGYEDYTLTFDGQTPAADSTITIENITCERTYELSLNDQDGEMKASAQVQFTFLPLVEVNVSSCNGTYYTTGTIRVTDSNFEGHDSTLTAAYRYRGATAQGKHKKAYAIKMRDAEGNSVDHEFFGLRNDNNWILDAMAIDPACMRNRVSTDLWNDFSTPPYYKDREKKARTGTRGRFVEVFLNGAYHGIYCMTEKMDRKQLKLKKYVDAATSPTGEEEVHGVLYKSAQWSYEVLMGHDMGQEYFPGNTPRRYHNTLGRETWAEFEIKYPDYEDEAVEWEPLYNAVNFVATSSQDEFERQVADYFDYPMLKDYYLFIELLLATDNHGKNMFYYAYDRLGEEGDKLGLAPWDLDGVWGCRWDGSYQADSQYGYPTIDLNADLDFEEFLWKYEHGQMTLFYKLNKMESWKNELKERYAELRTTYFNEKSLNARVENYAGLFADSKADKREESRWDIYHSDIQTAASYMTNWMETRIKTLDEKYGFDPTTVGINDAKAEAYFSVTGGKGCLAIQCGKAQEATIYNMAGAMVRRVSLHEGLNAVNGLAAGIYVVNGKKVIVE